MVNGSSQPYPKFKLDLVLALQAGATIRSGYKIKFYPLLPIESGHSTAHTGRAQLMLYLRH